MNRDERDALETRRSEEASRMSMWKSFMAHPGWEEFKRLLEQDMKIRQQVICTTPVNTERGVFAQEFFKGEFSGINTALEFPQTQYETAKRETSILDAQLENEYEADERVARATKSRVDTDKHFGE
jgi:hypothetical protein